ncbi:MAG: carbohydrate ABC transporter permease [Gammaproteobacteria bacterium WSBS_2016_MAG_OTU1]
MEIVPAHNAIKQSRLPGIIAWVLALLMFFPVLWMLLSSFKTELQAISTPPVFIFQPTLDNYEEVFARADYFKHASNSVIISVISTLLAMLLAIPCAWTMAFYPTARTRGVLLWMLSTKMLPPVGVLLPVYLIFRDSELLDTLTGLSLVYAMINLPIIVWMLYVYFKEIPVEILEAARMDGAGVFSELLFILLPITAGALASTFLLSIILAWNEAFWSINLTASDAAPLTAMIASFSSPEGLFWAKLSAASVMAVAPILLLGWFCQKQLVRGLTFGAVK